jgi:hypothetical protein
MVTACPKPPAREPKPRKPLPRRKAIPLSSAQKRRRSLRRNLKPLKRGPAPKRKKNVLVSRYMHPAWKKLRLQALRRDRNRCRLQHAGCLGRASQVHHTQYNKGRGVKRLLVDLQYLLSCCEPCHKVEDPWLGNGRLGKGSRKANGLPEQPALPGTDFLGIT